MGIREWFKSRNKAELDYRNADNRVFRLGAKLEDPMLTDRQKKKLEYRKHLAEQDKTIAGKRMTQSVTKKKQVNNYKYAKTNKTNNFGFNNFNSVGLNLIKIQK